MAGRECGSAEANRERYVEIGGFRPPLNPPDALTGLAYGVADPGRINVNSTNLTPTPDDRNHSGQWVQRDTFSTFAQMFRQHLC